MIGAGAQQSENWAGYVAATSLSLPQKDSVSDVKGNWTVPAVTGTSDAYSSTWVGIDGFSDNTVEQVGVSQNWINGAAQYYAWYEMYPNAAVFISSVPVSPGDNISAEVSYLGSNQYSLSITNITTGQTFTTVQTGSAQRQSAEWIVEAPSSSSGILPLADFGLETFTAASATLNGHTGAINDPAWQNESITMVSPSGAVEASVSPLSPDGTSFKVAYGNANFSPIVVTNTGGDCSQIGTWNTMTKTCILNRDVTMAGSAGIEFGSDGVTVDGAGHVLAGEVSTNESGVLADTRTGVTIKNLNVRQFQDGIYFTNATSNNILNNTTTSNFRDGISLNTSGSNKVSGNTSDSNSRAGLYVATSTGDTLIGNTVQNNTSDGILLQSSTSLQTLSNVVAGNPNGIFLSGSNSCLTRGNKISSSNTYGVYLNGSSNNEVSNNVILSNATQAYVSGGSGNIFYGGTSPGNYWSDFNSPAQGCHDNNADGICDAAYNFTGGSDPQPVTLPFEISSYNWTWYDDVNSYDWVLLGNQRFSTTDVWFDLDIAGSPLTLPPLAGYQAGQVPAGRIITSMFGGIVNGPVVADSRAGGSVVTSQRTLWPQGGSSLEEVIGTESSALSNLFYWPWYDQHTSGTTDWILVSNPNGYQVYYEISIAGTVRASGNLPPGSKVTPTFPGLIGGLVRVQAWTDNTKTEPSRVMASQRVLSNGGIAFNEVPGIAAATLSSSYYWTWYDMIGGTSDWILVANPPNAGAPIYYTIRIAGTEVVTAGGPIAPGASVAPVFPGTIGGPVEVSTFTDPANPGATPANSIATQRTLWGPSFEEVPGRAGNSFVSRYAWTWYDQVTPGMTNWVLVANPTGSSIYYEVRVAGNLVDSGSVSAGGLIAHTYPGVFGGPVDVESWTDSSKTTSADSLASQRVLFNGFFNEVWGQ